LCVQRIFAAERDLIIALDSARQSITRCERVLELLTEARRLATIEYMHQPPNGPISPAVTPTYPDRLTNREVEVLRLIAAGNSNRQIADQLFISPRTIERHIANIYLKIDAHSKAEATRFALQHHLV
jgi:DNA-binding NarL/FixJ family response regulator